MNWKIHITVRAEKQIRKLPKSYIERIRIAIDAIESNPFIGDIEKLDDKENIWRRRIGSYRIFYETDNSRKTVYIFDVKRRASSTY